MKTSTRHLGFFVFLLPALFLRADPVDSRITAVTVYTDRAVVTRSATTQLAAGQSEIVFASLPEGLLDQSLQVSGSGTAAATILDVSARRTFVDFTPNERVKALEDELKSLQHDLRSLDDRQSLLQAQSTMLDRMEAALFAPPAKDVPRPELAQFTGSLNYLTEQRTKIVADRNSLDEQRSTLQDKINAVQAQLNELRGPGGKAFKTVTVRVAATQPGRLDLTIAYTIGGASWRPNYDARVAANARNVELGYFGIVQQRTGEDWKDVALTLSTARPALGGAAPKLQPWELQPVLPRAYELEAKAASDAYQTEKNLAVALPTHAAKAPPRVAAQLAEAAVESGATSAIFRIATSATVPSDGSSQKVPITSAELTALPEYQAVPKRQTTAFLTCKVSNTSDFPLLAGTMNVFLDGTFVATSRLDTVMPGEKFDLALGADEGIAVKHKRAQKFIENTGLTNSGTRITYEYLLTIQNNKKTAERVNVSDQLPLARHEKITVKQLAPDPRDIKPDNEGTLKWQLDLKPGEKRELTVKFTVEYPNDLPITGLE